MTKNSKDSISTKSEDLKSLHQVLTMIATDIDNFCDAHDITYYLMGGTALGAVRHGGFIPWDDDFDIFMDRENYLRFQSACEADLDPRKYYLQREDTDEWPLFFSKVRLNDTLYVERWEDVDQMHSGVYIDVMCLHNAYKSKVLRYLQFLAARTLSTIALSKRGYHTSSIVKRLALKIANIIRRTPIKHFLLQFVRSLDGRETTFVGHYFGRAPFPKTFFPKSYLGTPRRVPFENVTLPVPEKAESYLATRFGPNFMKMPDQKTRDSFPSHLLFYDLGPYS